jgi:hypothetical protein
VNATAATPSRIPVRATSSGNPEPKLHLGEHDRASHERPGAPCVDAVLRRDLRRPPLGEAVERVVEALRVERAADEPSQRARGASRRVGGLRDRRRDAVEVFANPQAGLFDRAAARRSSGSHDRTVSDPTSNERTQCGSAATPTTSSVEPPPLSHTRRTRGRA